MQSAHSRSHSALSFTSSPRSNGTRATGPRPQGQPPHGSAFAGNRDPNAKCHRRNHRDLMHFSQRRDSHSERAAALHRPLRAVASSQIHNANPMGRSRENAPHRFVPNHLSRKNTQPNTGENGASGAQVSHCPQRLSGGQDGSANDETNRARIMRMQECKQTSRALRSAPVAAGDRAVLSRSRRARSLHLRRPSAEFSHFHMRAPDASARIAIN